MTKRKESDIYAELTNIQNDNRHVSDDPSFARTSSGQSPDNEFALNRIDVDTNNPKYNKQNQYYIDMISNEKEILFENITGHGDSEVKISIKNQPIIQVLGDDKSTNNNPSTTENNNNIEKDRPKKKQRLISDEDDEISEHFLQNVDKTNFNNNENIFYKNTNISKENNIKHSHSKVLKILSTSAPLPTMQSVVGTTTRIIQNPLLLSSHSPSLLQTKVPPMPNGLIPIIPSFSERLISDTLPPQTTPILSIPKPYHINSTRSQITIIKDNPQSNKVRLMTETYLPPTITANFNGHDSGEAKHASGFANHEPRSGACAKAHVFGKAENMLRFANHELMSQTRLLLKPTNNLAKGQIVNSAQHVPRETSHDLLKANHELQHTRHIATHDADGSHTSSRRSPDDAHIGQSESLNHQALLQKSTSPKLPDTLSAEESKNQSTINKKEYEKKAPAHPEKFIYSGLIPFEITGIAKYMLSNPIVRNNFCMRPNPKSLTTSPNPRTIYVKNKNKNCFIYPDLPGHTYGKIYRGNFNTYYFCVSCGIGHKKIIPRFPKQEEFPPPPPPSINKKRTKDINKMIEKIKNVIHDSQNNIMFFFDKSNIDLIQVIYNTIMDKEEKENGNSNKQEQPQVNSPDEIQINESNVLFDDDNEEKKKEEEEECVEKIAIKQKGGTPPSPFIGPKKIHPSERYAKEVEKNVKDYMNHRYIETDFKWNFPDSNIVSIESNIIEFKKEENSFTVGAIKSPLGTGKSTAMEQHIIDLGYDAPDKCIVQPTPRIAFSKHMHHKYNTPNKKRKKIIPMNSYLNHKKKDIDLDIINKILIQLNSLKRLQNIGKIDLLILDELEALLSLFDSNLLEDPYQIFNMLLTIVEKSEKIICMDAFMGKISAAFIKIIENIKGKPIDFIHHYTVGIGVGKKFKFTVDSDLWRTWINTFLKSGKKLVIPTNSKKIAQSVKRQIEKDFPNIRIKLYTADDGDNSDFDDIHISWRDCQVLIYSPKITCGLSFIEPHFDIICPYFISNSCPAQECCQMIYRVRNYTANFIFAFIEDSTFSNYSRDIERLPTTSCGVHEYIQKSVAYFEKIFPTKQLDKRWKFKCRPIIKEGEKYNKETTPVEILDHKEPLYNLITTIKAVKNESKMDLLYSILILFVENGMEPVLITEFPHGEEVKKIDLNISNLDVEVAGILEADDATAMNSGPSLIGNPNKTKEEQSQLRRFILRVKYNVFTEKLIENWIKQFYADNYALSGPYIRNTNLYKYTGIALEKGWVDKKNLVDALTKFLTNERLNDIELTKLDKNHHIKYLSKIIEKEEGGIASDQELLGYDISKTLLWACNLDSFFDNKTQKLKDLEEIYNQRILELEYITEDIRKNESVYKEKISKNKLEFIKKISNCHLFKNIKKNKIEKLFKFNLHTINMFFVIPYGIFIYGIGNQNCYLKWPSWIDYKINNNEFSTFPIYDETLKNTNYGSKISKGQRIPNI
jgi:hypothetical protein